MRRTRLQPSCYHKTNRIGMDCADPIPSRHLNSPDVRVHVVVCLMVIITSGVIMSQAKVKETEQSVSFLDGPCWGKPGCWWVRMTATSVENLALPPPPVCGALGVIGLSGRAHQKGISEILLTADTYRGGVSLGVT